MYIGGKKVVGVYCGNKRITRIYADKTIIYESKQTIDLIPDELLFVPQDLRSQIVNLFSNGNWILSLSDSEIELSPKSIVLDFNDFESKNVELITNDEWTISIN